MMMESFTVHITFLENSPKQLKELGSCFKTERKPLNASTQLVDSIELKYIFFSVVLFHILKQVSFCFSGSKESLSTGLL